MQLHARFQRVFYHSMFWLMFLLYRLTTSTLEKNLIGDYWWGDWKIIHLLAVDILFKALFAYGFIYFLVPKLLDTKRIVLFGISSLVWLYIACALYIAFHFYHLERIYTINMSYQKENMTSLLERLTKVGFILHLFSQFLFPSVVLGAIKFYKKKMHLAKIEEEKNKMELMMLKNQLNPHFLFNTLNNLYSYVVTGSPQAPKMIVQLSGILDYALYKSQDKTVPLEEEITAIDHFIELEKNRYGERLTVSFRQEGLKSVPIAPLLLLSLVENAFKHGASADIEASEIDISISADATSIKCNVWNTKSAHNGESNDAYKEGIGMANFKRQLNIMYKDKHDLKIDDREDSFQLSLQIFLDHE